MSQVFTVAQFRTQFQEFQDSTVYPDSVINLYSGVAQLMVLQSRWKNMWLFGVSLYVAHEITLSAQDLRSAAVGGTPGTAGGIANTKTVGSVTVGYDSNTTTEKDAGWWNKSNYGMQFIRLARIFGAGCYQL